MANSGLIDDVLSRGVASGDVAGVVAITATDRSVIHEAAFGKRELGGDPAMTLDTVMFIASMTKALTTTAAMQLVEGGKLKLGSPAAEVVPELAEAKVLEGFDASGQPMLRAPKRAITLEHLLTHTAGFSYDMWSADIAKYQEVTGTPGIISCQNAALTTPLRFDPGEQWDYGINLDWVGKMVEAVSGQNLEEYLQENVLSPLGMNSTSFKISSSQRARLATMHARGPDGSLAVFPFELNQEPEFHMGGGGLYGTAQDYIRFTQMILNHGTLDGNQVLKPETVATMSENHIGDIDCVELKTAAPAFSNDANFSPGMKQKWGLGFLINTEQTTQGRSPGGLSWAGLANTFFWIDPDKNVTGALFTQILPFFDHKAIKLFRDYEEAVYKSL